MAVILERYQPRGQHHTSFSFAQPCDKMLVGVPEMAESSMTTRREPAPANQGDERTAVTNPALPTGPRPTVEPAGPLKWRGELAATLVKLTHDRMGNLDRSRNSPYSSLGAVASTTRGVSPMKILWQTETDRLVCRWSEVGERAQYDPRWIQDASRNVHQKSLSLSVPDFTRLSPFGGKEWYALDRPR